MRSQSFGFLAVRTSAKEPLSLAPRSVTLSLPAAMPSLTRRSACARSWYQWPFRSSSGVYGPQSQTITSPAPYCLGGDTPFEGAEALGGVLGLTWKGLFRGVGGR